MEGFLDGDWGIRSLGLSVFVKSQSGGEVEIKPSEKLDGFVSVLGDYQDLESAVIAARGTLDTRRDETRLKRDGYSQ